MFGGVNVWRITELKVIGEIKFGEWIDFGHKVLLPAKIWLVKVWRITDDSPNSPNFPAAKHSRCTILFRTTNNDPEKEKCKFNLFPYMYIHTVQLDLTMMLACTVPASNITCFAYAQPGTHVFY